MCIEIALLHRYVTETPSNQVVTVNLCRMWGISLFRAGSSASPCDKNFWTSEGVYIIPSRQCKQRKSQRKASSSHPISFSIVKPVHGSCNWIPQCFSKIKWQPDELIFAVSSVTQCGKRVRLSISSFPHSFVDSDTCLSIKYHYTVTLFRNETFSNLFKTFKRHVRTSLGNDPTITACSSLNIHCAPSRYISFSETHEKAWLNNSIYYSYSCW